MSLMSLLVIQSAEVQRGAIYHDMGELANITRELTLDARETQLISTKYMVVKTRESLDTAYSIYDNHSEFMDSLFQKGLIDEYSFQRAQDDNVKMAGTFETINYTIHQNQRELLEGLELTTKLVDSNIQEAITLQEAKMERTIRNTSYLFLVMFFFGIVAVVSFSYYATRKITGPIGELQRGFKEFSRGNFNYRIKPSSKDEIGILSEEFNRMVAEHTEAIRSLAESEEKYRGLVEHTTDAIIGLDLDQRIMSWNKGAEAMLGYPQDEVVNMSQDFVVPEGSRESCNLAVKEATFRGHVRGVESERIAKDGRTVPVEMSITALEDKNGEHIGFVTILRDITKRKEAALNIKESEEKFRTLFNNASDAIFIHDLDGRMLEVNNVALERLGYTRDEIMEMTLMDIDSPEHADLVPERTRELKEKGGLIFETAHVRKDGVHIPAEVSGRIIEYKEKPAILSIARDITKRKMAEMSIRESEEKFRTLAEQSPNMIFINKRGRIVFASMLCEKIMGYTREELYSEGFDFMDIIAPVDHDKVRSLFQRHIQGEDVEPYEYGLVTRDGRTIDALIATKLMDYQGENAILGIVTDITERKEAEREIQERVTELEQWQRLTTGREKRMIELKKEVNALLEELGKDRKYDW